MVSKSSMYTYSEVVRRREREGGGGGVGVDRGGVVTGGGEET